MSAKKKKQKTYTFTEVQRMVNNKDIPIFIIMKDRSLMILLPTQTPKKKKHERKAY